MFGELLNFAGNLLSSSRASSDAKRALNQSIVAQNRSEKFQWDWNRVNRIYENEDWARSAALSREMFQEGLNQDKWQFQRNFFEGQRQFNQNYREAQRQFNVQTDQGIQRRVADAMKAGVHPLAALGIPLSGGTSLSSGAPASGGGVPSFSVPGQSARGGAFSDGAAAMAQVQAAGMAAKADARAGLLGSVEGLARRLFADDMEARMKEASLQEVQARTANDMAQASYYNSMARKDVQDKLAGPGNSAHADVMRNQEGRTTGKFPASTAKRGIVNPAGKKVPAGPGSSMADCSEEYDDVTCTIHSLARAARDFNKKYWTESLDSTRKELSAAAASIRQRASAAKKWLTKRKRGYSGASDFNVAP